MLSRSKDNKNVEVTSRIIMLTKMKEDNFSRMINKLGVRFEKRVSPVEKYYFTFKRLNYSFIFTKHEILNVYIQMILVVNLEYYISFRTSITREREREKFICMKKLQATKRANAHQRWCLF